MLGARVFALALLLAPVALPAQESAGQSTPVLTANRTIIVLGGPLAGHSSEERARRAIPSTSTAPTAKPRSPSDAGAVRGQL